MDILCLPDVVLRHLMRKVDIQDRARLRLTSRTLARLVAATNAGFFYNGSIVRREGFSSIRIDDAKCVTADSSRGDDMEELQKFRGALFYGICIDQFTLILDCDSPLDSIRAITDGMKLNQIRFVVTSHAQLDNALQLMADFPNSKYKVEISNFDVDEARLHLIPPTEKLSISRSAQISIESFNKLLNTHRNIILGLFSPEFTAQEFRKTLQNISNDYQSRTIKLKVRNSTIVRNLRHFGLSESISTGYCINEFETLSYEAGNQYAYANMKLRYRQCWLDIVDFDWADADLLDFTVLITLSNFEISESPTRKKAFVLMKNRLMNSM